MPGNEHLACELRSAVIACVDRDDRGKIAAGAVATDHQPRRVDAERHRVVGDPFRCGDAILDRGGEFCFRRKPVVHRDHDQLAFMGERTARHRRGNPDCRSPSRRPWKNTRHGAMPSFSPKRLRGVDPRRNRTAGAGVAISLTDASWGGSGLVTKRPFRSELHAPRPARRFHKAGGPLPERPCKRRRHRDRERRAWGVYLLLLKFNLLIPGRAPSRRPGIPES